MSSSTRAAPAGRWRQLGLGIVCMVLIANLQYAWTLFVAPIHAAHGWALASIQLAFSLFIATETWLTPIEGWLVDRIGPRRGPRLMVSFGALLVGAGWVLDARAGTLGLLYVAAALAGTGAGAVYATCVGNAVKWFPDRRGLAVGLTAAGFGGGAALTVVPIRLLIAAHGYQAAFFWFGIGQGVVLLLIAQALRGPARGALAGLAPARVRQSARSWRSGEVLRSPAFWVLYAMFVLVSASGLMVTAQLAPIARDYGLARAPLLLGASALSVALVVDNLMNGLARPCFGALSDRIGRETTMAIAFALGAVGYWLLGATAGSPWGFVIFAGLVFFTWGEIFSLFPATCTDLFGPEYATANASLLYTAKGASAFLVPLANVLKTYSGSWHLVFLVSAAMNVLVVLLALGVLRPLRVRQQRDLAPAASLAPP